MFCVQQILTGTKLFLKNLSSFPYDRTETESSNLKKTGLHDWFIYLKGDICILKGLIVIRSP